jgi:hypothetical protein
MTLDFENRPDRLNYRLKEETQGIMKGSFVWL